MTSVSGDVAAVNVNLYREIQSLGSFLDNQTEELKQQGLFKQERSIASPQSGTVTLEDHTSVLNFCANNYLGLANHPDIIAAAHKALDRFGYGMARYRGGNQRAMVFSQSLMVGDIAWSSRTVVCAWVSSRARTAR